MHTTIFKNIVNTKNKTYRLHHIIILRTVLGFRDIAMNKTDLNLSSSKMAILAIVSFKTMVIIIITTTQVTGSVLNIL